MLNLYFYRYNRLIKRIEKKFKISLFFISIFRLILFFLEKLYFKKLNPNNFTKYSNYYLDKNNISEINNIISAGIADDNSFERELINSIKINKMICIDPTDIAEKTMNNIISENIVFMKSAIYDEMKMTKIFFPFDENNFNLSIDNLYNSKKYKLIKTITVEEIMKKFKISKLDILKLDVEGVSDIVIKSIIKNNILPKQIVFEIERPASITKQLHFFKRLSALIKLLKIKYNLYSYTKTKLGFRIEVLATLKD